MLVLDHAAIATAAQALDAGSLVVVPTQRWYMLCGRADLPRIPERIFQIKRRSSSQSLLLVAKSRTDVADLFQPNAAAEVLMNTFWPGDLALLLNWREASDGRRMSAVGATAALVAHPGGVLGDLARLSSHPVAATSANISPGAHHEGCPPAVSTTEVHSFIARSGADVAVLIDGGTCPSPFDMTIIDCTTATPSLRREGIVHPRAVRAALTEAGLQLGSAGDERAGVAIGTRRPLPDPLSAAPRT